MRALPPARFSLSIALAVLLDDGAAWPYAGIGRSKRRIENAPGASRKAPVADFHNLATLGRTVSAADHPVARFKRSNNMISFHLGKAVPPFIGGSRTMLPISLGSLLGTTIAA